MYQPAPVGSYGYAPPSYYGAGHDHVSPAPLGGNTTRCLVSIALAGIAAVASYYCLIHGLARLDMAVTMVQKFTAGVLIYSGLVFSVVAVANVLYGGCQCLCHDEDDEGPNPYMKKEARYQIGLSLLAPVAAAPAALCFGVQVALNSRH